ncbi:MAG: S8 family serine peptidase, partial [Pseudomonadales bacterium]|nr:S8 family serine peptidase [Pseudomonadales bacterium]
MQARRAPADVDGAPPSTLRVVQLRAVPDAATRARIEALGARTLGFLPESALIVRAPSAAVIDAIEALPGLRWQGPLPAEWKVSPELGTRPFKDASRRDPSALLAEIHLWKDADLAAAEAAAIAQGLELRAAWDNDGIRRLLVRGDREALVAFAEREDVAYVIDAPEATKRNDDATWVVQSNVRGLRPIWDQGLHGQGQIIGNIDGRLDMNSCYFDDGGAAPGPSHRKVIAYRSNSGLGADSHGTHTNGTHSGDSGTRGAWDPGDGHAFASKIVFGNLSDIDGSGSSPSNLINYLSDAHDDGARVHANSWGDDGTTAYTTWSRDIDEFSWQNEDSLVLFAITNGGSLRTPENAKNVLAVGATQREENADNHCSGGEGPTNDGRRKPEIYAPGCSTESAASNQACGTRSLTGTSMACPAVAGAAALVRQYFTEGYYPAGESSPVDAFTPTGALLKATLISGAMDMTGVNGYPSDLEGWGRVNLDRSLFFDGDARGLVVLDDLRRSEGLETNDERSYDLDVVDASQGLRVTLVFTEPPAELLASAATINNLDLELTAPDGTTYFGNVTDGFGNSQPGGSPDGINNLEQVLFDTPQEGTWTVRVRAASVPVGPQGFALVATGGVVAAVEGVRLRGDGQRIVDEAPGGNDDGRFDPGETITLPVTLLNAGRDNATGVTGGLTSNKPNLARITRPSAIWPDLPSREAAESIAPHFEVTLFPEAACGERVTFTLTADSETSDPSDSFFTLPIGDPRRDYPDGAPADIPPAAFDFVSSALVISDVVNIEEIDVSVDIRHGNIGELRVFLVSPSGTQVVLHDRSSEGTSDLIARFDLDRPVDGPGSLSDFVGEPAPGE